MATVEDFVESKFRDDGIETEVVAFVLRKKPVFIGQIEPEWFYTVPYRNMLKIQKTKRAVFSKNAMLGELKRLHMIPKGEAKVYAVVLEEIYNIPLARMSERSAKVNLTQLIDMFEGRTILLGLNSMMRELRGLTVTEIKNLLKEFSSGVRLPDQIVSGDYVEGFKDRLGIILEKQDALREGRDVGVPTGIRMFDYMLLGGLMKSEFGVIGGQPGVGKTAMLTSIAVHAWQRDLNVLLVTGEMPKADIEFRIDADVADISASSFRLGNLSSSEMAQWRKNMEKEKSRHDNFLEVVSFPRNFTSRDIEGQALQIQDEYEQEIDLICIDYLNIMNPSDMKHYDGAKDWKAQADVVWDVKALAASFNNGITIWTAGQLKDEYIDASSLSLDAMKYARAISETAPIVVGLVRTEDNLSERTIELQVLKVRNAPLPTRAILLRPNLDRMRIHEELVPKTKDFLADEEQETRRIERKKKSRPRRME